MKRFGFLGAMPLTLFFLAGQVAYAQGECEPEIERACHDRQSFYGRSYNVSNCLNVERTQTSQILSSALSNSFNDQATTERWISSAEERGDQPGYHASTVAISQCLIGIFRQHRSSTGPKPPERPPCEAPPSFSVRTEVQNVGPSLQYCIAYIRNSSPYPIACQMNGRRVGVFPGQDQLAEGWALGEGQLCQAEARCEKDLRTMKLDKRWCTK